MRIFVNKLMKAKSTKIGKAIRNSVPTNAGERRNKRSFCSRDGAIAKVSAHLIIVCPGVRKA